MLSYEVTGSGYRIYQDGKLWIVQEEPNDKVYPGETAEERAQAHLADLSGEPSDKELLEQYEQALNELGVMTDEAE